MDQGQGGGRSDTSPEGLQPEPRNSSLAPAPPSTTSAGDEQPKVLGKLKKWGDYCSFGNPIEGEKLLPMKTPLTKRILSDWNGGFPKHVHTVRSFLDAQSREGREVGLIVDLCNHECLYDDDIPPDVKYEHIWCVAKEVPQDKYIQSFVDVVDSFHSKHPNKYVAVHCAYGFNRTGFMICCYLIQSRNSSISEAVRRFKMSRSPGIKHEKFLKELHDRYGHLSQNANEAGKSHFQLLSHEQKQNMEDSLMSLDVESGKDLLQKLEECRTGNQDARVAPSSGDASNSHGERNHKRERKCTIM